MATKKFIELQESSDEDLKNDLKETLEQYKKLKFDHAVRGLENPLIIREVRRDIARLKTEVRRRELGQATPEELAGRSKIRSRRSRKY